MGGACPDRPGLLSCNLADRMRQAGEVKSKARRISTYLTVAIPKAIVTKVRFVVGEWLNQVSLFGPLFKF